MPVRSAQPTASQLISQLENGKRLDRETGVKVLDAVARDGKVSREEADALRSFLDNRNEIHGTPFGEALVATYARGVENELEKLRRDQPFSQLTGVFDRFLGGLLSPELDLSRKGAKLRRDALESGANAVTTKSAREFHDLMQQFPKAVAEQSFVSFEPVIVALQPDVEREVQKLRESIRRGEVFNENDVYKPIREYLETNYPNS